MWLLVSSKFWVPVKDPIHQTNCILIIKNESIDHLDFDCSDSFITITVSHSLEGLSINRH